MTLTLLTFLLQKTRSRPTRIPAAAFVILYATGVMAQPSPGPVQVMPAGDGWAANSINAVVFRKNSLASSGGTQFIAYYNQQGNIVIGKRKKDSPQWLLDTTSLKGNIKDAHNSISIMLDGEGYLHLAWNQHNNQLNYCRSTQPFSSAMSGRMPMTGKAEVSVSYPEFHKLPKGDLLFMYRDGGSGRGNLIINRYDCHTAKWTRLQDNLIDGENQRSAYWQACIGKDGVIHVSWVWRESPDVASNHDICYARSADGGLTWEKSNGERYSLPINAATAEYILRIPQNSELINQTSMCTDGKGNPIIASYWRETQFSIVQYHIVYQRKGRWLVQDMGFRRSAFSLGGGGTKQIPISRPQVISWSSDRKTCVAIIFRDEERKNRASLASKTDINSGEPWKVIDLDTAGVGAWEPSFDIDRWNSEHILNLYMQRVTQADAEGIADMPPQPVSVLEWKPGTLK